MSQYVLDSDLHDWIDFDSDSPLDSDLLAAISTRASAIIDAHCGRVFTPSTDLTASARLFDPDENVAGRVLYLDRDLAEVTSVVNGDGTTVAASDYVLLPQSSTDPPFYAIKLKASSNLTWTYDSDPEQSVVVTATWTYGLAVPDVIKHATTRLSQWLYKQRSTDSVSDQPLVTATGLTIMPAKLPADVVSMLGPFVRMRVGAFG